MIEEIKDGFDNLKDTIGDKGFIVLMIGAVAFGLYNLLKSSDGVDEGLQVANAYASYPDVDSNADVVIDSINNSIEGAKNDIIGSIDSSTNEVIETTTDAKNEVLEELENQNEQIADYVNEGKQAMEDLVDKMSPTESTTTTTTSVKKGAPASPKIAGYATDEYGHIKRDSNGNPIRLGDGVNYYKYTTQSGLNTSKSLVDALKYAGEDSSFENRKKIAEANGITNYVGSGAQDRLLLSELKKGELQKV